MPTFVCRIGKADGTVLEERLEAEDEAEAKHRLDRQGVVVFAIRPAGRLRGLSFDLPSLRRGLVPREFLVFNHELLVLIKAGLPIMKALDILAGRTEHPAFGRVLGAYCHAIVIRTYGQQVAEELARFAPVPVINGLTDLLHPTQVLADLKVVTVDDESCLMKVSGAKEPLKPGVLVESVPKKAGWFERAKDWTK